MSVIKYYRYSVVDGVIVYRRFSIIGQLLPNDRSIQNEYIKHFGSGSFYFYIRINSRRV